MGWIDDIQARLQQEFERGVANQKETITEHLEKEFQKETVKLASTWTGQQVTLAAPAQGAPPTVGPLTQAAAVVSSNSKMILVVGVAVVAAYFLLAGKK